MLPGAFLQAIPVLEHIEKHQHKAYFVGGCVRDYLLKRPIGDIDIATSASPSFIQKIFPKVIPVGIEHGTVIVRHNHESFEVTTFRIDGDYTDKRHPDSVVFIDNIDKDLERRDFTINALAMDLNGNMIDLFDGIHDIENRVIRTVGNGYERFTEDPLRIIRAIRFSSQLGFTIDPKTLQEMKEVSSEIKTLAIERIANEFSKLFAGNDVNQALNYVRNLQIERYLPVFCDSPQILFSLPVSITPLQSFAEVIALFHLVNPKIEVIRWVKEWKCSNKTKQEALRLVEAYSYFETHGLDRWLIYQLTPSLYKGFIRISENLTQTTVSLHKLEAIEQQISIRLKEELTIDGYDLMAIFPERKRGRWIQELLNCIEYKVVSGELNNNKKEIKEWIKWNPPETD